MNRSTNSHIPDTPNSFLALLGLDEQEAKERYPHIYKASLISPVQEDQAQTDHYIDSFMLSASDNCDGGSPHSVTSNAKASLTSVKKTIIVKCDIFNDLEDPGHLHPTYAHSCFETYTDSMSAEFETERLHLKKACNFTTKATFTRINVNGVHEMPVERTSLTSVSPNGDIVTELTVERPKRTQSSIPGQVVVCYNRKTSPTEKADYAYENVIITKDDEPTDQTLSVHLPFAGSLTLNSAFTLVGLNRSEFELHVGIKGQSGGCDYNLTGFPFDKVFSINGNTLSWNLKKPEEGLDLEDWHSTIKVERVFNNAMAQFYAKVGFIYRAPDDSNFLYDHVVIHSPYSFEQKATSNTKIIETILIWWGCLGKDTLVEMADGTRKPIGEITAGEMVRLTDGSQSTVDCVLSGKEEQVFRVTAGGYTLLVTQEHPLMTRRGLIRVKDLTAADALETIAGFIPLDACYPEQYGDLVYSLQLDPPGCHLGNGIVCGDFAAQQQQLPYQQKEKEWHPYEDDPLSNEIADLLTSRRPIKYGMESMAAKPYYACRFEDTQRVYAMLCMSKAPPFGDNAFTLEGWFFIEAQSRQLLKQEGGFSLSVDSRTFVITAADGRQFSSESPFPSVGCWTHLFFTYDDELLSVGVNGQVVATHEAKGVCFLQNKDMVLGGHFTGYLRRLSVYSVCLEQSLLRARMFQNVCSRDMEALVAFVDGAGAELVDSGPNLLPLTMRGGCRTVNVAQGFRPEAGHCALLENAGQINPGGFASNHFGVYLKFHTPPVFEKKSVLFSNGRFGEPDALLLYLKAADPFAASIWLDYGGQDLCVLEKVAPSVWLDVILSYDATSGQLAFYRNGEHVTELMLPPLKRTRPGEFKIGNGWDTASDCDAVSGCLFTEVALYSAPISPEKAHELSVAQPFVFDPDCVALFNFESGGGREWISRRELCITPQERVLRAQTSASHLSQTHYWYDIFTRIEQPCAHAVTLLRVFAAYMQGMFGIAADGVNEEYRNAACHYLEHTLLKSPVVIKLFEPNPDDRILCACITQFGKVMDVLLTATCANNLCNRHKSSLSDKLGIDCILASVPAIVLAGNHAVAHEREGMLREVLEAMRTALKAETDSRPD